MHKKTLEHHSDFDQKRTDDSSGFLVKNEIYKNPDYYRNLYENCPLPYQSLDEKGRIIDVNNAWLEIFNYESKEEIIGTWFGDYVSEDFLLIFKEKYYNFKKEGETCCQDLTLIRKDKTKFEIILYGRITYYDIGKFRQTHCLLIPPLEELKNIRKHDYGQGDFIKNCIIELKDKNFKNIYKYIGNKINEISGNVTVICSFNSIDNILKIENVSGLGLLYEKLTKVLQTDPCNITFEINEYDKQNLLKGQLIKLDQTFTDYTSANFTKPISLAIEKLFRVDKIYIIGFSYKEYLIGCSTIFETERKKLINPGLIEDFASFISVFWNRN